MSVLLMQRHYSTTAESMPPETGRRLTFAPDGCYGPMFLSAAGPSPLAFTRRPNDAGFGTF